MRLLLDEGLTKAGIMERMGIKSLTSLERWIRGYRKSGPGAHDVLLLPSDPSETRPLRRREVAGPRGFLLHAERRGYRQVALALRNEQGLCISGKTVLRLMREEGLRCRIRRKRYDSYRGEQGKIARNVLGRDFRSDGPLRKLVTDVAEFSQPWGKAYLSSVMDLYSNEIVAWLVSEHANMAQVNEMMDTLEPRLLGPALAELGIRGCRYRWPGWIAICDENHLTRSMSKKGCSPDGSAMEGFFGRLRNEFFHHLDRSGVTVSEFCACSTPT